MSKKQRTQEEVEQPSAVEVLANDDAHRARVLATVAEAFAQRVDAELTPQVSPRRAGIKIEERI